MAKKAKKAAAKTAAAPRAKPSGNRGVVVGVIVAIVVIIILIFLLKGREAAPAPTGPEAPTVPTAEVPQPKPTLSAVSPEFERYCKESTGTTAPTLGYTPCSCRTEGNELKIALMNSGKEDIQGIYFEVKGETKTIYFSDNNNVAAKQTRDYVFSMDEITSQLGEKIVDILAHPAQNNKACLNTRLIIVSKASCVPQCKAPS